jgi:hypothetical protein
VCEVTGDVFGVDPPHVYLLWFHAGRLYHKGEAPRRGPSVYKPSPAAQRLSQEGASLSE